MQSVMISYRGPNDGTAQLQLGGTSSQVLTAPAGQAFTIAPIARGTYTATVTITGESGAELCRTQAVTFHVRQPSLLAPVRQQMNRRAKLQLRLQETVEGLSIVAITYYASQLVQYVAKGAKYALPVNPDILTAVSIPLIAGLAALGLRSMRRKLAAEEGAH